MSLPGIILTGFMGSGKSTVGRLLADELSLDFVDSDDLIVERCAKTINQIFDQDGEAAFRLYERAIAREFSGKTDLVIATGGGLMVDPLNAVLLGQGNVVFYLQASLEEMLSRLKWDGNQRPLIAETNPGRQLEKMLADRAQAYQQFIQVGTSNKDPDQVAKEIASIYQELIRREGWQAKPVSRFEAKYPGGSYPIIVGRGTLSHLDEYLDDTSRLVVITDENVAPLHAHSLDNLDPLAVITVPAGEANKTLDTVRFLYDRLLAIGADRQTTIVALGGGVVGDMAGFVAATYMRGMPFIQCPTTVLAMVDASVGAKTGVDLPQGKNLVGAFKQPRAVVADLDTLTTLEPSEFRLGLSEIVKHGLISSPELLQRFESGNEILAHFDAAQQKDKSAIGELLPVIVEAILIKRDIVESDPYETGRRKVLNLGHTFAHAIEQVSGYQVRHGEAVAIGLVAAARLSSILGFAQPQLEESIRQILRDLKLPVHLPDGLIPSDLILAMYSDKKKEDGQLRFVLIRRPGDVFVSADVPETAVMETLKALSFDSSHHKSTKV